MEPPATGRTLAVRPVGVWLMAIGAVAVAVAVWALATGSSPAGPAASPISTATATTNIAATPVEVSDPDLDPIVVDPPTDDAASDDGDTSVPAPTAIEIPRLEVDARIRDIDLDGDRRLEAPSDPAEAGWYVRSPRPGDEGPALIAGHVDSKAGPGVFYRLDELEAGDKITVVREDGSRAEFVVRKVHRWAKDELPTDEVFRKADGSELRLITCGGEFDRGRGSYHDNIVVFASGPSGSTI